jgi:hypothetical protein
MGAHVYVIRFTSDVVKVGWSQKPHDRLKAHNVAARVHGGQIAEQWISKPHAAASANEKALIAFCAQRASSVAGAEYFTGISYSDVVEFAKTLNYKPITAADRERLQREEQERGSQSLFAGACSGQSEQRRADAWWSSEEGLNHLERQLRLSREDIGRIEEEDRVEAQEMAFATLKAEHEVADLQAQLRDAEARLRQQKDARTKVCNYLYFRLGIC